MIFYRGSDGFRETRRLLDEAVQEGLLSHLRDFASLTVFGGLATRVAEVRHDLR